MEIWVKVFKNRPNKICGRQPLNSLEHLDPHIAQILQKD